MLLDPTTYELRILNDYVCHINNNASTAHRQVTMDHLELRCISSKVTIYNYDPTVDVTH